MDVSAILLSAMSKPVSPERPIGCCRVYVAGFDKSLARKVAAAAKKAGLSYQAKTYYGARNAIYVAYDNMDGIGLARASAIVDAFKSAGINCYRDEGAD